MLSKKLITFVSAVLAMGLLVGCGGKPGSYSESKTSDSTTTSTSGSSGGTSEEGSESSSQGSTSAAVTHIVTFYDGGRVYGDPVTVNDGATVAKPATDPTKEGDEFVNYTFDNWYPAGSTTAYNFATPVTSDLDLYSKYNEVAKKYDLVVFVYGVNGAATPTTYITEEESNLVFNSFKALEGVQENVNVLWKYSTGLTNPNFNKYVNDSKVPVDVVISGNKLDDDTTSIATDATYGKVAMGAGWFANTSRKVAITAACNAEHKALAIKLYEMASAIGPNYEIILSKSSLTVQVGETEELTATYYGAAPTWELKELNPAGCFTFENGVVTGVEAGTGKIVATDAAGHTAECSVEISAIPYVNPYDLNVYVYGVNGAATPTTYITEEESNNIKNTFLALDGVSGDLKINWVYSTGLTNPNFNKAVMESEDPVDLVISGNKLDNDTTSIVCNASYGKVKVGAGWFENTSRYLAITKACDADHLALAVKLYDLVRNICPTYEITLSTSSISLEVGGTAELTATYYGAAPTWELKELNPAGCFTFADGTVTAVASGKGKIVATDAAGHTAECIVKVLADSVTTLNVYMHTSASKTTYMTADNIAALEAAVDWALPVSVEIVWHEVSGVNNAGFVEAIKALTTELPDILICAKANFGEEDTQLADDDSMPNAKLKAAYAADGQSRYFAGYALMPAAHVEAATAAYNVISAL